MAERDEEVQHGSTVLPGAPMPWFAQPHGAEPERAAEPPTDPAVEEPTEHVEADAAQPAEGEQDAPARSEEEEEEEEEAAVEAAADDGWPADDAPEETAAEGEAAEPAPVAASAAAPAAHGRHRAPEPERPRSRRLFVLLGILVVVLVVAAIVLFVWPGLLTSSSADDGAAPAAPSSSPSAPVTVTLVVPATLAGLSKLSGAADAALRGAVSGTTVAGLTSPVSAVYGKGKVASAQVIAWKATAPPAQDSIDAAFTGFEGSAGAKVTAVQPLAVGELGGRMSCGETTVSKTPSLLCFWADEVSFGSVTLLSPKERAAAETMAALIRAGVEQKG
jgi:hypothetical protein